MRAVRWSCGRLLSALLLLLLHAAARAQEPPAHAAMLHSIVFVTKRPGGYDVLLEGLARQTVRNYELICVDELADHRAHAAKEMAARLQVNLVAITRSKPKTHPETRFGIANAINTGFVLARGHIVTVLQDNIYLPDFFVEKTLAFHAHNPVGLISYPELRFVAPEGHVDINQLHDVSSVTVFKTPVQEGPQLQGWRTSNEGTMPKELWENMRDGARGQFDWLECACCSLPYSVMVELNGVDESLDTGDDCHEVNLRDRAKMLDFRTWSEGSCPVQLIDHHRWDRSEVWTRFTRDTNIFRWDFMKQQMEFGEYPLRAPNNFDLTLMTGPALTYGHQPSLLDDFHEGPRVRILSPVRGAWLSHPLVRVEFEVERFQLPRDGTVCFCTTGQQQSICVDTAQPVALTVHRRGTHILHALLYDTHFRLVAEHQVHCVQNVLAPT